MKALIIAAGKGKRLKHTSREQHKSLMPLLGLKIIERVILGAREAGINEFVIVTGYRGQDLRKFLGRGERFGVSLSYVENKDWKKANGISVLKAKDHFKENFVLLMSDHVFDPETLRKIQRVKLKNNQCVLAVDRKLDCVLDVADATKVMLKDRQVIAINKELNKYNAFDTGMFVCSPYIFKVLEKMTSLGKNSLTDAMRVLAKEGKLKGFNNRGRFWSDCDTYADIIFTEKKLIKNLTKSQDGVVSKNFNRKVSGLITKLFLIKTPVTPNIITFSTLILAILTFFLLVKGRYPWVLYGGLLIQFLSILDGCDGEIARLKFLKTKWGAFFDTVIDRYADIIIIFGMVYGYWVITHSEIIWPIGFFVVSSLIIDIFTSREIKVATRKKIKWPVLNVRRDTRLLILALGAVTNQVFITMLIMLIVLNLKVLSRLIFAKMVEAQEKSIKSSSGTYIKYPDLTD